MTRLDPTAAGRPVFTTPPDSGRGRGRSAEGAGGVGVAGRSVWVSLRRRGRGGGAEGVCWYPCEGAGGVVEPPALPGPAPVVVISDLLRGVLIPGPLFDACVRRGRSWRREHRLPRPDGWAMPLWTPLLSIVGRDAPDTGRDKTPPAHRPSCPSPGASLRGSGTRYGADIDETGPDRCRKAGLHNPSRQWEGATGWVAGGAPPG